MSEASSHWDSFQETFPSIPSWSSSASTASSSSSPDFSLPSPLASSISSKRRQHSHDMLEEAEDDSNSAMSYSTWQREDFPPSKMKSENKGLHRLKVEEDVAPMPLHLTSSSSCSSTSPVSPKFELQSPATSTSASSSPSNLSPTSGAVSRRRRRPPSSTARLESHRKYDSKRRCTFRSLFEQLRGILKAADATATRAKCVLQSSLEANELEMRMAALEKNIDDLSTRELMLRSAKMIRQLTEAKSKLERQMQEEQSVQEEDADEDDEEALADSLQYGEDTCLVPLKKRRKVSALISPSAASSSSSSSSSSAALSSSTPADSASLDCLNTLVHTISVLNQYYSEDMKSVAQLQLRLPQSITDISCYFPSLSVSGADGRMALMPELVGEEYRSIKTWLNECNTRGIDLLSCIREPLTYQIHALCFVLSNKFAYKAHQILEAPTKNTRKNTTHLAANTIFQSLYQSIQTHQQQSALTSSSSSTAVTPWCHADISEEELQKHPLGGYALSSASAYAVLEVLAYLASLGESECQRQIQQLMPIAFATFPTLFSTVPLPFLGMTTREKPSLPKRSLHPLLDPSFELILKFFQLYSGQKPVITITRPIPSPNSRLLYAERDVMLVRHSSGLPLAHLTCNIRLRFGEEQWTE